jgi:hypothetical protein
MRFQSRSINYLLVVAITLGAPAVYGQHNSVRMTVSGTAGTSAANLLIPNASASDYIFSGTGTLGSFEFRSVSASEPSERQPSACSGATKLYGEAKAGGGVFRFADGSLLMVNLTQGSDCVDLVARQALCIRTFQIVGGTRRFANASGTLTFTETLVPVVTDSAHNPVLVAATGTVEGTVSGVRREDGHDEE